MAASAPPRAGAPAGPPPSATPPPGAPDKPTPPAPPARSGELRDLGVVRRDSVHAVRWALRGTAKVSGEVDVGEAHLDGATSIGGKLTADAFGCEGTLEVEGAIDVRAGFTSRGSVRAASTLHATDADLRGTARIAGALTVEGTLRVRGALFAPSVVAGEVHLEGAAEVPGDVRARRVVADFDHDSRLGTVEAQWVRVHAKVANLVDKLLQHERVITVRRIEADLVDLEGVDVGFVRSKEIILGRDCHVTEVEGTVVRCHRSSSVGPESKSLPPYGLRR